MAILLSALIAAVAANHAAKRSAQLTMDNARELQDRERRQDEKSVAALLSADLHDKLLVLVGLLPPKNSSHTDLENLGGTVVNLEKRLTSRVALEAALPKLGSLGHRDSSNLLGVFNGLEFLIFKARLVAEARGPEQIPFQLVQEMKTTAEHIGLVLISLWNRYQIDRPNPLGKSGLDMESRGLEFLKTLGI